MDGGREPGDELMWGGAEVGEEHWPSSGGQAGGTGAGGAGRTLNVGLRVSLKGQGGIM